MIVRTLCLLLLTATAVHAEASFDCRKASAPVEKAICAEPSIADLDGKVDAAYKAALQTRAREPAALTALRTGQRDFLAARNRGFGQPDYSLAEHLSQRLVELQKPQTVSTARTMTDITSYFALVPVAVFDDTTDGVESEERDLLLRNGKSENWIYKRIHAGKAILRATHPSSVVTMTLMNFGQTVMEVHIQNEKAETISYWRLETQGLPLERYRPRLIQQAAAAARHDVDKIDRKPLSAPVNPLAGVPADIVAHVELAEACRSRRGGSSVDRPNDDASAGALPQQARCNDNATVDASLRKKYAADHLAKAILDRAKTFLGE